MPDTGVADRCCSRDPLTGATNRHRQLALCAGAANQHCQLVPSTATIRPSQPPDTHRGAAGSGWQRGALVERARTGRARCPQHRHSLSPPLLATRTTCHCRPSGLLIRAVNQLCPLTPPTWFARAGAARRLRAPTRLAASIHDLLPPAPVVTFFQLHLTKHQMQTTPAIHHFLLCLCRHCLGAATLFNSATTHFSANCSSLSQSFS